VTSPDADAKSNDEATAETPLIPLNVPPDEMPERWLAPLDWFLRVLARLIVIAIGLVVLAGASFVLFKDDSSWVRDRILNGIRILSEDWKALTLILLPVFYLPMRRLIYRAKSFGADHPAAMQATNVPSAKGAPGSAG
jgi:hypothetical protein